MRVDAMTKPVSSKGATPANAVPITAIPTDAIPIDAVPITVVIVTMDTHLASATERAYRRLLDDFPGLTLRLHAATEWGDDPAALARCRADIAAGDIVICAMLFMEDHYREILADLKARRDTCDATGISMARAPTFLVTIESTVTAAENNRMVPVSLITTMASGTVARIERRCASLS